MAGWTTTSCYAINACAGRKSETGYQQLHAAFFIQLGARHLQGSRDDIRQRCWRMVLVLRLSHCFGVRNGGVGSSRCLSSRVLARFVPCHCRAFSAQRHLPHSPVVSYHFCARRRILLRFGNILPCIQGMRVHAAQMPVNTAGGSVAHIPRRLHSPPHSDHGALKDLRVYLACTISPQNGLSRVVTRHFLCCGGCTIWDAGGFLCCCPPVLCFPAFPTGRYVPHHLALPFWPALLAPPTTLDVIPFAPLLRQTFHQGCVTCILPVLPSVRRYVHKQTYAGSAWIPSPAYWRRR